MKKYSNGFTLVEIIVSLAIFSIVAVVALGALMKIISANNKAQTLQTAITNLNYSLESISREIRVGKNYRCLEGANGVSSIVVRSGTNKPLTAEKCDGSDNNKTYIAFESPEIIDDGTNTCNLIIAYRFSIDDGTIGKWKQENCFNGSDHPTTDDSFSSIIDENVKVTGFYLEVEGDIPFVTMRISGYTGDREKEKTEFDVQTGVYARVQ